MYKNAIPDSTLVSNYIQGCEASLGTLIEKHKQRLYSFIYSKVQDRDITEDIFQDTFIKVIRTLKKGSYNEEGKFLPWVMRFCTILLLTILESQTECLLSRIQMSSISFL